RRRPGIVRPVGEVARRAFRAAGLQEIRPGWEPVRQEFPPPVGVPRRETRRAHSDPGSARGGGDRVSNSWKASTSETPQRHASLEMIFHLNPGHERSQLGSRGASPEKPGPRTGGWQAEGEAWTHCEVETAVGGTGSKPDSSATAT